MNTAVSFVFFLIGFALCCPDPSIQRGKSLGLKLKLGSFIKEVEVATYASSLSFQEKQAHLGSLRTIKNSADNIHLSLDMKSDALAAYEGLKSLKKTVGGPLLGPFEALESDAGNCTCDFVDNCVRIFQDWPQSEAFVVKQNCTFVYELLGENRNATIGLFLSLFSNVSNAVNKTDKDTFLTNILQLLTLQTEYNPAVFVSHGTDHSVRVMMYGSENYKIPQVLEGMHSKYGCTTEETQFVVMLHSMLHDIGYVCTPGKPKFKFIHALIGRIMAGDLFQQDDNLGARILQNACSASENLVTDFLDGIRNHNADDQSCLQAGTSGCSLKISDVLADMNGAASMCNHTLNEMYQYSDAKQIITRNYTQVIAVENPIGFTIRLDDNLDSSYSRLTGPQRDPLLLLYLLRVYVDGPLRNIFVKGTSSGPDFDNAMQAAKKVSLEYVRTLSGDNTWSDEPSTPTGQVLANIGLNSYLFFYSVYIAKDLGFENGLLTVDLYEQKYPNLTYSGHVGPAFYQINRLAVSMHSCYLTANVSFLDSVNVFLVPTLIPNINATQPLRAFAQKPTFSANGTIPDILICGNTNSKDCDIARQVLTVSNEVCLYSPHELEPLGAQTTCCDFQGMQQQIKDLTFPTTNLMCPATPYKFPEYAIILVSVGGGLLILLVPLIVFLVVRHRRKHKRGEEDPLLPGDLSRYQ
jgi:hypothetical protein